MTAPVEPTPADPRGRPGLAATAPASPVRRTGGVLAEREPRFRLGDRPSVIGLMNGLPLGIAILDDDGACVLANAIFAETVGSDICRSHSDVLELAVADDREHFAGAIAAALFGAVPPRECRIRLVARPDEPVVVTMLRPPPEWGFALLLAIRDIREQVRLERQVVQATKMQAVGQLAGGIAHDFNNILTAVLGLCDQLLARRPSDADDFDDIDQIRQNAERAADLVRQLLAFARQQTLRPRVLEIAPIVDGLMPLIERLVGPGIELRVIHGEGLGAVRVDSGQLEQVLVNLAVNARDAMAGKGMLRIESRAVPAASVAGLGHDIMPAVEHVAITVADTGPGIPPDIAARIFEPFFTTKPVGQGTGLGLSTVYGIVKQTGGFVFTGEPPGGGASFTLYLPTARRQATPAAGVALPTGSLAGTVLLVEDDRSVRGIVERALVRHGLTVVSAADGFAALALLDAGDLAVDLLVSDVVMPGMDGGELLGRARERTPGLHVVLMSGYAEPPQRRALDQADVYFLAKPFAVAELITAVRRALPAGDVA